MDPDTLSQSLFWQNSQSFLFENAAAIVVDDLPVPSVAFASSGSTGAPCRYVLSKESLLRSARAVNAHLQVCSASRWGLCLPWWHVGGFAVAARVYAADCALDVFRGRWDAARCVEWLTQWRVSHLSLVPTQVFDLVSLGARAPSSLIAVVVGGGRLDLVLGQKARDLGWPVLASYGMTEAGSQIATHALNCLEKPYTCDELTILPCWDVAVSDTSVIQVKGPALFHGTLSADQRKWRYTAREGEWYETCDCGHSSAGQLAIYFRADDLVKVLGELVSPARIESELADRGMPVGKFAVLAVPDSRKGCRLVLVLEDASGDSWSDILADYHATAPGFARFDELRLLTDLPRSPLGKILRRELLDLLD